MMRHWMTSSVLCLFLVVGCAGTHQPTAEEEVPALLVFTAEWCGACQRDKPIVEQIKEIHEAVMVIDADRNPKAVKLFKVKNLPTYLLINSSGEEIWRVYSARTALGRLQDDN